MAMVVHYPVVGDAKQPGGKRRPSFGVRWQSQSHPEEYLARQILSQRLVVEPEIEVTKDGRGVAAIKLGHRLGVALLGALDEGDLFR